jgi:hypothetical protein
VEKEKVEWDTQTYREQSDLISLLTKINGGAQTDGRTDNQTAR